MAKATGIDIGSHSLKIVEIESNAGKFEITQFFHKELPPPSGDFSNNYQQLTEIVQRIFKENRLETNQVAISLPTQDCILREILVDFTQDDLIRKMIKYEAEKYLQSYPIEEVIVDFYTMQELDNKAKLFLAIAPKKFISRQIELLKKVDIDPLSMDVGVMGLVHLAKLSPEIQEEEVTMIVDFGAVSTKLVVLENGDLRHVRAVRMGANLRQTIKPTAPQPAQDFDIDWEMENELIISLATPEGADVDRVVMVKNKEEKETTQEEVIEVDPNELFARLVREIKRTMFTLDIEAPLKMICITGGGSQLPGIVDYFQENFKIETRLLGIPEKVIPKHSLPDQVEFSSAIATGMALSVVGAGDTKKMNFRQEEFVYTPKFELLKIPVAALLTLSFIFFVVLGFQFQKEASHYEKEYDVLVEEAVKIWDRNFPEESLDASHYDIIYTLLDKLEFNDTGDSGSGIPEVKDNLERLKQLFEAYRLVVTRQGNLHKLILLRVQVDQYEGFVEGQASEVELLDYLLTQVRKAADVDPSPAKTILSRNSRSQNPKSPELRVDYKLDIGFKKPVGGGDF